MENFKLNDRVIVFGKNTKGKIAFIGKTHFADGQMFGVILDEPKGKYSGTIDNVCYFECQMNHGTFVRACQLERDCGSTLEDGNKPVYPNYLKESSSKHAIKTQGNLQKTEKGSKSKLKTSDSVDMENSRNKLVQKEENNIPGIPNGLKESSSKHGFETQGKTSKMGNSRKTNSKTSDSVNIDISREKQVQKENLRQVNTNHLKKRSSKAELKDEELIPKTENSKTKAKSASATVDILDNMHLLKRVCSETKPLKILKESRSTHVFTAKVVIPKPINSKRNANPPDLSKSQASRSNLLQDEVVQKGLEKLTKSKSTHVLTSKVETMKTEKSKRKVNPPNLAKKEASRSNLIKDEMFQKGDTITNSLSFEKNEERCTDEELITNELSTTKQRLSDQENRMIAVRSYLRMLTTYFKWNAEYEKSSGTGDDKMRSFLDLLIDNIVKKIQDVVSQQPGDKRFDAFNENSSVLTEENNFLLLRIAVLEKRNEVLTESLIEVREIFERAWNRSRSNKCKRTETHNGKEHDKVKNKDCTAAEESFTDIIEQETSLFVKSNPTLKTNPTSIRISEKLKGPERIKQYLESLLDNKGFYNQENTNGHVKDESHILETDDTRGQQFMYSSPQPKMSLDSQEKDKTLSGPTLASETKPNTIFQDHKKFPFEINLNDDPTKGLKDLISELSLNANRIKKQPTKYSGVNSAKKLLKNSAQKSNTEQNTSSMSGDYPKQHGHETTGRD